MFSRIKARLRFLPLRVQLFWLLRVQNRNSDARAAYDHFLTDLGDDYNGLRGAVVGLSVIEKLKHLPDRDTQTIRIGGSLLLAQLDYEATTNGGVLVNASTELVKMFTAGFDPDPGEPHFLSVLRQRKHTALLGSLVISAATAAALIVAEDGAPGEDRSPQNFLQFVASTLNEENWQQARDAWLVMRDEQRRVATEGGLLSKQDVADLEKLFGSA